MTLSEKILRSIKEECKVDNETWVNEYVMTRKKEIIEQHINNVFPIKKPGEKGGDKTKWLTKLTPKDRNHDGKIRANSREELEEKILAHYLSIQDDAKATVREILIRAVNPEHSQTGLRTLQRFDKHLAILSNIKISSLDEKAIRNALSIMVKNDEKITAKEFNQTMTCLNKIHDFCAYEHIDVCDIRSIVSVWRSVNLAGHHVFIPEKAKTKEQAFTKSEVEKIVTYAIRHPTYKSLAIALTVLSGVRSSEILALTPEDINLDEGYIYVWRKENTKKNVIEDYTKSNKQRFVYLSDDALIIARMCLELHYQSNDGIQFLFHNEHSQDGKMHLRALDDFLRTTIHEVLGLSDDTPARSMHDCRRTYASISYFAGTDIYVIQRQLGHSTVQQTWDYIRDIIDAVERRTQLKCLNIVDAISLDAENNEKNNIVRFCTQRGRIKNESKNTLEQQKTL